MERHIIHIDMDAFFASVEQKDFPELKGKPVAVGGRPEERSVVSAASYEARKFGIHSAMAMSLAVRRCPNLIIRPVRMQRYVEISRHIHCIFADYTPLIEPISIDEAFLDVSGSTMLFGSPQHIGREIKKRILDETGLIASAGIAPNKFLAKLASDLDKPDGFVVVTEENKQSILDPLDVNRIWGVGKVLEKNLKRHGIFTIKQLREAPIEYLQSLAGSFAETLHELAMGIDDRAVVNFHETKSISTANTFPKDIEDKDKCLSIILAGIEEVSQKLRVEKLKSKTITLKLRYGNFQTVTRSKTLDYPTDNTEDFWAVAKELFELWYRTSRGPLRLIGVGLSSLCGEDSQLELFSDPKKEKLKRLDSALDEIRKRHGNQSVRRASSDSELS